jgi:hypothetical protein
MRAELPRRGGLPIKRAREIASGTDGLWTLLWREPDSNFWSLNQSSSAVLTPDAMARHFRHVCF